MTNQVSRVPLLGHESLPEALIEADSNRMRSCLLDLLCSDPQSFKALLWRGENLRFKPELEAFVESGLLSRDRQTVTPNFQIWYQDGTWIITDQPNYPSLNRVFPVFPDENLLLTNLRPWRNSTLVADIGTGSGFLGLHAALYGCKVFATDINPRAIALATINARLNDVDANFKIVYGDTFDGLPDQPYDLIVSNPPFAPIPEHARFHIAGDGGRYGVHVIEKLLRGYAPYTRGKTTLIFTAISLVRRGIPLVLDLIHKILGDDQTVRIQPIYNSLVEFNRYARLFGETAQTKLWQEDLLREGYDSLAYFIISIGGHSEEITLPKIINTRYSGDWNRRFERYNLWLN